MSKVRKSFLKRFKFTKRGKIFRRSKGQGHNLAKKASKQLLRKKKMVLESDLVLEYKNF